VTALDWLLAQLDARDRAYAETLDPDEREVVASTIVRYQRRGQLKLGDAIPELDVYSLNGGRPVPLSALATRRPLVLVFGSFT
jgi:hypothetical protein